MWVWVNSGSWWWTGRPGVLWFMGSQRIGHDWATELTELIEYSFLCYTVNLCCLFILYVVVWVCKSPSPNVALPCFPLVTTFVFCVSESVSGLWISSFGCCLPGCSGSELRHAGALLAARGTQLPDLGSDPSPLHWQCRVLATESPTKSHLHHILDSTYKWYHTVFVFLFLTYFT